MRYAVILETFWSSPTGLALRAEARASGSADITALALYLLTNRHANLAGIYLLPLPYAAYEIGLPEERVTALMAALGRAGFAEYDAENETVWIPRFLPEHTLRGKGFKPGDKRVPGAVSHAAKCAASPLHAKWAAAFAEISSAPQEAHPNGSSFEGASKGHPVRSVSSAEVSRQSSASAAVAGAEVSPPEAPTGEQPVNTDGRTTSPDGRPAASADIQIAVELAEMAQGAKIPIGVVAREIRKSTCLWILCHLAKVLAAVRAGKVRDSPVGLFTSICAKGEPDDETALQRASHRLKELGGEESEALVAARLESFSAIRRAKFKAAGT